MRLIDGKKYIESVLNREFQGARITPDEYNMYLSLHITPFVKYRVELYKKQTEQLNSDIFNYFKSLGTLVVKDDILFSNGLFNVSGLSNDILTAITGYAIVNDKQRRIRFEYDGNYYDTLINSRSTPLEYECVAFKVGDNIEIYPKNITNATIYYIKKPNKPFLDYYIRSNKINYIEENQVVTLQSGDIKSDGSVVSGNVQYTSLTRELEFDDDIRYEFINEILKIISLKFKEGDAYGHANNTKQDENIL